MAPHGPLGTLQEAQSVNCVGCDSFLAVLGHHVPMLC